MASTYSLKFAEEIAPFQKEVKIYHRNKNGSNPFEYFVFLDEQLYRYKYKNHKWDTNLLLNNTLQRKILYFPKTLDNEDDIMMIKTEEGIDFYQYKDDKLNFLLRSNDFEVDTWNDIYGWDNPRSIIKCGYFYNNKTIIGILAKDQQSGLQFHGVFKGMLMSGQYPIQQMNLTSNYLLTNTSNSNFYLSDLQSKGQENIIVHSKRGMEVFEFDQENDPQLLLQIPNSSKINDSKEILFFSYLTGQSLKDIVLFNASGLFIYQYNNKQKNYNFIHYNPSFDKQKGWDEKYADTIRFKDINFDGREEMFFTGPRGADILTFDNYTLHWRSVLDVSYNAISERHSNLLEIGPVESLNAGSTIIFIQGENKLHMAKIELTEKDENDDFEDELSMKKPSNSNSAAIPEFIKLEIANNEKPHVLLRDQLDFSSIIKGVDKDTGKASFELPLIGLPNFATDQKMNLHYNGNSKEANILGIGWSFPFCIIIMDHQRSIFPENERYFLLLEDFPQQLLLDSEQSTDSVQLFKLSEEESEIQILFYKNEDRWEIDYKDIKQIFGRPKNSNNAAVNLDLSWKFWRGSGSSLLRQGELTTAWFLSEVRGGQTSATYYTYDINNVAIPESNNKFTRELYLKTISDHDDNLIVFNYSDKDSNEYILPPLRDERGNYNTKKVQTRYLTSYSLTTHSYRQEIRFNYKVENGKRFLTEIVQDNDPTNRPILQFFYKNIVDSHELERVVLPTEAEVEFSYETKGETFNNLENINLICDVSSSYKVDYGQDFVLVSYINNQQHVTLKMFNRLLTREMYSSLSHTTSTRFPFLGQRTVTYYNVNIFNNALVFTLDYESSKAVCMLNRENNKWSLTPIYFEYDKDVEIKIGYDFIAVLDATERFLKVIFWDVKSEKWIQEKIENTLITNSTNLVLQVSDKVFLIYNDDAVIIGFRNKNEWQSKVIFEFPGVIDEIKKTLTKFDLDSVTYNILLNLMKSNSFQVSNNFILFNKWNIEDTTSFSEIELFSLNDKYEVVDQEYFKIVQDDLLEFSNELKVENDEIGKSYLTLAYEKDGEKLKIIVKSFRGSLMDQIVQFCKKLPKPEDCIAQSKKETEEEMVKAVQQFFILEIQKYMVYLQPPIVVCGSTHFIFNGNNWELDTVTLKNLESEKWSVSIDDQFLLTQENTRSSIKLFDKSANPKQNKRLILDLQTKNVTQISNKYPTFLSYQTENKEVNLVFYELLNNANVKKAFTLPRGETVSLVSDHTTLVTHAESARNNKNVVLNLRHFIGMKGRLPNPVINRLTVSFNDEYKRITGYNYDHSSVKAYGDLVFYEKTATIPGNNQSSYGHVEESANITGNYDVTNNIYDANGKLIKIVRATSLNNNNKNNKRNIIEEREALKNSTLFDMTGGLRVAQFYPYEIKDEEVSYYGFEDYEVNKIGASNSTYQNHWFFNEADIVKQRFSLTGENYLYLSEHRLLGVFQPHNQNQHYVASCWIRTNGKSLEVGQIAPYLKAVVYAEDNREINGYFSEVKFQYDDWSYVEVILDLFYAKEVFTNLLSGSNSSFEDKDSKPTVIPSSRLNGSSIPSKNSRMKVGPFKIVVTVSSGINSTIHVDHIRFSPLNCNFKAVTYNSKTKSIKEVINANGLIQRYLYNDYQDQIVSINENGEIEKISSFTKSSSIGRIVNSKSKIEIQSNRGLYEDFNPHSFRTRWNIDNVQRWKIAPGELHHASNEFDQLKLRNTHNFESYGMRLNFALQSQLSIINFNDVLQLERKGDKALIIYSNKMKPVPHSGEILLIAENNRLMVWIDGGLYFDEGKLNKSLFDLNIYGNTKITDMLIFNDVSIKIAYFNALGEKVQEINLETANSAIVTEFLYDELGRQCITTKPTRLQRSEEESVAAYYSTFVTNDNPLSNNSVWKTNQIDGEFENLNPYGYYQVTYSDNPLNEKSRIGLPGQEFSISGSFTKRFSSSTENNFINKFYPVDGNYTHFVEHKVGNIEDIKVFNEKNNTVAWLISVPGRSDVLATYEYNDDDKLIRTLSPLYHEAAGTFLRITSHHEYSQEQNSLSVETIYNEMGNIIAKTSPDSGKIEYLYSDSGLRKFAINYSSYNSTIVENVVYFNYDEFGRLINTGKLISPPERDMLLNWPLTKNNTEKYQEYYHSDFEREPTMRGRLKRTVTYNDGAPFIEESVLNGDKKVSSKRVIVLNENDETLTLTTNKRYEAGKLREIEYPVNVQGKPFKLTYKYDKLGRIKSIGIPTKHNLFVQFAHNSDGHITTAHHLPETNFNFTRNYSYNSASYLTQLQDKFLTENIYYTEGSYGENGYGDGIIARTVFNATWHDFADSSKLHLNEKSFESKIATAEDSKLCFLFLKEAGYINQNNHQVKIYYPSLEMNLPMVCSTKVNVRLIQNILGQKGFPSIYGHLYDYGPYQELIRAKYFIGEDIPAPLHPSTFGEIIPKINVTTSQDIWNILSKNEYITSIKVLFKPHGKKGKSFIRSTLCKDLKSINKSYEDYCGLLKNILPFFFSKKLDLSLFKENLKNAFLKWSKGIKNAEKYIEKVAKEIIEMLEEKGYLENPLDEKFNRLFQRYQFIVPEIIEVLLQYFGMQLGEAEFDVEVHDIDKNGNHKHYYTGFDRYELKYRKNSNQIKTINLNSMVSSLLQNNFLIEHDSRGNVIQALHKGIKKISYHSVSNRVTTIELIDGKELIFNYDAQGERVLKRVLDATGAVKKEVHYVRDEFGRSLVERELTWNLPNLPPSILVTAFIYGPNGLIGFIRRDEYYSVITDHEGSIRLIVKDGEVVAAYDYLPYGNLMRQYGINSETHISYRYTGQEWDEESGLYNYHARLYDPSIGRFYQHDPKTQYFSPYKYAGNSPVSMVDPNGELAFLAIIVPVIFGAAGVYLAGASISGSWNPLKWDFSDPKLLFGMLIGGVAAFAPSALVSTVAAFTAMGLPYATSIAIAVAMGSGSVGAYLGMAAANNEWDPSKWDLSNPSTWNGAFTGFLTFAGIADVVYQSKQFFSSLSSVYSKSLFILSGLTVGGSIIGYYLSQRKLDFSKPGVYFDILSGLIQGFNVVVTVKSYYRIFVDKKVWKHFHFPENPINMELTGYPILRTFNPLSFSTVLIRSIFNNAVLDDELVDLTFIYGSIKNEMMVYSNLRTSGSLLYKQRRMMNDAEFRNKAINAVKNIAKEIVETYKKIIKDYEFSKELYSEDMRARLEAGKIPNAIVAITLTIDNMAFVAYSSKTGPGFLSPFSKKDIGYSPERPKVPRIISTNDDENINNFIEFALEDKRNMMVEINYKTYCSEKHKLKSFFDEIILSSSPKLKSYFNNVEVENFIEKIGMEMNFNGYIQSKERAANIILSFLLQKYNLLKKTTLLARDLQKIKPNEINKLFELEKKIVKLEQNIGLSGHEIDPNQTFEEKKKMLIIELKMLKEMKAQLYSDITDLNEELNEEINIVWEGFLKKYLNEFSHWSPTIFIEPQLVSLLLRNQLDFPPILGPKYTSDDFQYLPAEETMYRRYIFEFEPIARCLGCQKTTRNVTNILIDLGWENAIAIERKKLLGEQNAVGYCFNGSKDFLPYSQIKSEKTCRKIIKKKAEGFRKKRSTISGQQISTKVADNSKDIILENDKNDAYHVDKKSANNTNIQSTSFTNNLVGWMKSSINKLFDSKKILSEKTPNSSILKGITDSKNSLSAVSALVDLNSTVLLLDTVVRKVTKQKYISTTDDNEALLLESKGYSLDIGFAFEKTMKYAASKSGISMHRFNIHYLDVQDKVIDKIMTGKLDEIAEILISHAESACPHRETGCPGKLSRKKFQKFIDLFSKIIDIELIELMEKNKKIKHM